MKKSVLIQYDLKAGFYRPTFITEAHIDESDLKKVYERELKAMPTEYLDKIGMIDIYKIGEFDDESGIFIPCEKVFIISTSSKFNE